MNIYLPIVTLVLGFVLSSGFTIWQEKARVARDQVETGRRVAEERRARRYADQRSAYVTFAQACVRAEWGRLDFLEQHGQDTEPASYGLSVPLRDVVDSLTIVQLLGAAEVAAAAETYSNTLHRMIFYAGDEIENLDAARKYRAAMRLDLTVDAS